MIASDIKHRRKAAGISRQDRLVERLPYLPSGRKLTRDVLGYLEVPNTPVDEGDYQAIISTIDEIAAERSAA